MFCPKHVGMFQIFPLYRPPEMMVLFGYLNAIETLPSLIDPLFSIVNDES
jgi:hypothetical protein